MAAFGGGGGDVGGDGGVGVKTGEGGKYGGRQWKSSLVRLDVDVDMDVDTVLMSPLINPSR